MTKPELSRTFVVRLVFFGVNAAMMLMQLVGAYTPGGLWGVVVVAGIAGLAMLHKIDEAKPAAAYLCLLFAAHSVTYIAVHFDPMSKFFNSDGFEVYSEYLFQSSRSDISLLLLVGIVLLVAGFVNKKRTWFAGAGCGIAGLAFVLGKWTSGDVSNLSYSEGGRGVVVTTIILFTYWTVAMHVVCKARKELSGECLLLSSVLLAAFFVINVHCTRYVESVAAEWESVLLSLPEGMFSWWRVALTCVLLIVLGILARDEEGALQTGWADANLLFASAAILFAARVLMSNYFVHSWLFFLLFVIVTMHAYGNACSVKTTCGLRSDQFFIAETVAFIILSMLLCWGLWANVLVTIVFFLFFYYQKPRTGVTNIGQWIAIVTCMIAEAFARMAFWRLSTSGCVLLGVVYVVSVITILTIGAKHPAGKMANNAYFALVAVCVGVLCLASLRSPVHVEATTEGDTIIVATGAEGEGNTVRAFFVWKDAYGNTTTKRAKLKKSSKGIPVRGEVLTIVATDSNGVSCTRDFYYAPWVTQTGKE